MQRHELDQQHELLATKLKPYPRLRVTEWKMDPYRPRNLFTIKDSISGMGFKLGLRSYADLPSQRLEALLKQFLRECDNPPSNTPR